jgi:hypothetical protein
MKPSKTLSAAQIERLTKPGAYRDSAGLYLKVGSGGGRSWVFRFMLAGTARNAGLGKYPEISLAQARQLASEWRAKLKGVNPVDPLLERRKVLAEMRMASERTFGAAAELWFARLQKDVSARYAAHTRSLVERAFDLFGLAVGRA